MKAPAKMKGDVKRLPLLSICAHVTGHALKSDEVGITEKVEAAAEFVETAREILEKAKPRRVGGFNEPV